MSYTSDPTPTSTFILKIASRCNLNCTYCYEYNLADHSWQTQPPVASIHTIQQTAARIAEHVIAHNVQHVSIIFHGGEPLLAGADFIKVAADTLAGSVSPHAECTFGIQTNGILLSDVVIRALAAVPVYVGLSIDGPATVHDIHRVYRNGRGSHDQVVSGSRWLLTNEGRKLFAGILAVIDVTSDPHAVFNYLASFKPPSIDFLLPHGNWTNSPPMRSLCSELTPYADWLITVFDSWFDGLHSEVRIRIFEDIIEHELGGLGSLESLGLAPVTLVCVAPDGSIEAVDTLKSTYESAHRTGLDVYNNSFDEALNHPAIRSRQLGIDGVCSQCKQCRHVTTCGAGYYPHRWNQANGFDNPSVYCPDLMKLIAHIQRVVRSALATDTGSCATNSCAN